MASRKPRSFEGMNYRTLQRTNSTNRSKLRKPEQQWLKENGYRNVGWEAVIALYQKIEQFFNQYQAEDSTLEELFLEADRIGNKYLTQPEIDEFQQKLAAELSEIETTIEEQFPDTEPETIDFGSASQRSLAKKNSRKNQKTYRTTPLQ